MTSKDARRRWIAWSRPVARATWYQFALGGFRKWSAKTSLSLVRGYDACEKVETWRFDLTVPVPP